MRAASRRVAAVAVAVFAPVGIVVAYGLAAIAGSTTVWENGEVGGPGGVHGVPLEAGAWYRIVLKTDCFSGGNFSTHLAAMSDDRTVQLIDWAHDLDFKGRACRSSVQTREFTPPRSGNYTVRWEASADVLAHNPRVRVVQVAMPLGSALQLVFLATYGGFNVFASVLTAGALWGRRPPGRSPTSFPVPRGRVPV